MTKPEMRAAAKARLRKMPDPDRAAASAAIAQGVMRIREVEAAGVVLLYAALPSEVATDALAEAFRRRGTVVTYPRCLPEPREMVLHRVSGAHDLQADGLHGIREPSSDCPVVRPDEVDLALVPGLAWDRNGRRLGRGAGYYDRLFADPRWRGIRCGLFFAAQEVPSIPVDPWDANLHLVVTEHEVWRPR